MFHPEHIFTSSSSRKLSLEVCKRVRNFVCEGAQEGQQMNGMAWVLYKSRKRSIFVVTDSYLIKRQCIYSFVFIYSFNLNILYL